MINKILKLKQFQSVKVRKRKASNLIYKKSIDLFFALDFVEIPAKVDTTSGEIQVCL